MRSGGPIKLVLYCVLGLWFLQGCRAHNEPTAATSKEPEKQIRAGKKKIEQDVPRLIVNKLSVEGLDEQMRGGLTSHLCATLSENDSWHVICFQDIENLIQAREDLIKFGACDDDDCVDVAAGKMNARFILRGSIHKVGSGALVRISMIDNQEGKIVATLSEKTSSSNFEAMQKAVSKLARGILEAL